MDFLLRRVDVICLECRFLEFFIVHNEDWINALLCFITFLGASVLAMSFLAGDPLPFMWGFRWVVGLLMARYWFSNLPIV